MAESGVLKILYVLDILKRTDEKHPVNSTQIKDALAREGFKAERKAIGNYIKILRDEMGYEILLCENRNLGWYMVSQEFEDYELKMLVDSVASAKFLTAKNSRDLINKLKKLATKEGVRLIDRNKVEEDSLKLVDGKFAIKFDTVMRAIANQKQLCFQYEDIGPDNKRYVRKDGKYYQITPYYLGVWGYEYFVIANTTPYDNVSAYRVDMMKNLTESSESARPMAEIEGLKDIGTNGKTWGDFIKQAVKLKYGDVKSIQISGINHLRREVMKKFGNNLMFRNRGTDRFAVSIEVSDSEGFYQWIAQYGNRMKIEGPKECQDKFKEFLIQTLEQYD